jgi:ribonuclease HI
MSYYAVAKGKNTGVFLTWNEAKVQIEGFKGARFQRFTSKDEAENFVQKIGKTSQKRIEDYFKPSEVVTQVVTQTISELRDSDNKIIAFTDGACPKNGNKKARASFAVVWHFHPEYNYAQVLDENPNCKSTNNRGELSGVIHAIKQSKEIDRTEEKVLVIYSDSMLVINTFTKWMKAWKSKGWKKSDGEPVANLDLIKELDHLITTTKRRIIMEHVEAHTTKSDWKSVFNRKADAMAGNILKN